MGAMTNSSQDDTLSETLPMNTGSSKEQAAIGAPGDSTFKYQLFLKIIP